MKLSLDHIHYRSQSFEETRKFYVEVMGGKELESLNLGVAGSRTENLQIELGGTDLLFALDDKASTEPTDECNFPCVVPPWNKRHGVYHIAMLVEDCVAATQYFVDKAAEVYKDDRNIVALGPFDAGDNILASFLYAPDGMAIELKENMKWSWSDKN